MKDKGKVAPACAGNAGGARTETNTDTKFGNKGYISFGFVLLKKIYTTISWMNLIYIYIYINIIKNLLLYLFFLKYVSSWYQVDIYFKFVGGIKNGK